MSAIQFQNNVLNIQQNMFNFAMMLTANRYDAEDLLQDTTLRVLNNQDKYVENTNFKGWVLTIMRNIFINNYRKGSRNQMVFDPTGDLFNANIMENSKLENPEETMNIKEIYFVINSLNEDLKEPFSMYLEGYKYNEISNQLDLPLGTVKSRIFFARRELQRNLRELVVSG